MPTATAEAAGTGSREHRPPTRPQGLLEPDAVNAARPVLRGPRRSNAPGATRQIETAYLELKSTILGRRVLRARTPPGIEQEVYALLTTYQALRLAMADATHSRPGIDPDRASFTTALHAARDLLVQAAGVIAETTIDLVGTIGRLVLANLMPARRTRTSPRAIKRASSKYTATANVNRTSYKATIHIDILTPQTLDQQHQ